jgi:CheY-like chemotaxis protein
LRGDFAQFQAAGCDGYLIAPVRPSSLLSQTLGPGGTRDRSDRPLVEAHPVHAPAMQRRLKVLLAEDNEINALVARRMLEHSDCDVVHVTTGLAAVAVAGDGFHLVFMDMHMPEMDGIEATRVIIERFRGNPAARPYIVALTANAFPEDRALCIGAGMDDYLAKPFERREFEDLLARLRVGT